MWIEFLLLGLIGEHVRGYYSGKGKSGGGKFIGGNMGSKEKANEYSDLRKAAAGGDADAQKKMEQMRDKANKEREQQKKEKVDNGYKTSDNSGVGKSKDSKVMQLPELKGTEKQVAWASQIREKTLNYWNKKADTARKLVEQYKDDPDFTGKSLSVLLELETGSLSSSLRSAGFFENNPMNSKEGLMTVVDGISKFAAKQDSAKWWIENRTFSQDYIASRWAQRYVASQNKSKQN